MYNVLKKKVLPILILLLISITVFSACSKVDFKVSFIVDGDVVATVNTNGSETIKMPEDPVKEDYEFKGWYWDKGTWNRPFTANSLLDEKLTSNMSVYARWEKESVPLDDYLISANDFTVDNSNLNITVPNSTLSFSFINQLTFIDGITFTVATDIEGNNIVSSKIIPLLSGNNNVYILAKSNNDTVAVYNVEIRRRPLYEISFSDGIETQTIEEDSIALIPDEPTKIGYVFDKWLYNGTEYDFDTPVTSNMNIIANWIANNYTIEFDANKPTNTPTDVIGSMQDLQCTYNTTVALTINSYALTGYTFAGWTVNEDGSGAVYSNGQNISKLTTIPNDTVTLYAKWNINSYTVTLNRNITVAGTVNGSGSKVYNSIVTITATTNEGYTWLGWFDGDTKVSEGTSLSYTFTMPAENKTYEARWLTNEATISFNNNGGEGLMSGVSISTGEALPANIFTRSGGYAFHGWSLTSEGDVVYTDQYIFIVIEDGMAYNLYAQWLPYTRSENHIYFGEYPQTIKKDSVTVGDTADSQGYFLGSDGHRYAKIVASPLGSDYTFSTGATVTSRTAYYFKVEPIKWRILEETGKTAFILAEFILDNHRYDDNSNNYKESEIRAWLNNEFYNIAFSDLQKQIILTTEVDNSLASTGNSSNPCVCANTNDKIFLLSRTEALNTSYGFNNNAYRERLTTDYGRAKGSGMSTSTSTYGKGRWWLRSPNKNSIYAYDIFVDGDIYIFYIDNSSTGVVPSLNIQLS